MAELSDADLVAKGVKEQAMIDSLLAKAYKQAGALVKTTEEGVKRGWVQGIAAKTIIGDARAAQGKIAAVAAQFSRLHQVQTDACVAAGADLGSVTTAGGIAIGGVSVMGGGR